MNFVDAASRSVIYFLITKTVLQASAHPGFSLVVQGRTVHRHFELLMGIQREVIPFGSFKLGDADFAGNLRLPAAPS